MPETNRRSIKPLFTDGREPIPGIDVPHDDDNHGIEVLNALNRHKAPSGTIAVRHATGLEEIAFKTGDLDMVPVPEVINITPGLLTGPATPRA